MKVHDRTRAIVASDVWIGRALFELEHAARAFEDIAILRLGTDESVEIIRGEPFVNCHPRSSVEFCANDQNRRKAR